MPYYREKTKNRTTKQSEDLSQNIPQYNPLEGITEIHMVAFPAFTKDNAPIQEIRKSANSTQSNINTYLKKHKVKHLYPKIIHLSDEGDRATIQQHLLHNTSEDIRLVIHADGLPFVIGFEFESQYDMTAFELAECLSPLLPEKSDHITIDILACKSAVDSNLLCKKTGTVVYEFNFARDLSTLLYSHNKNGVIIKGYTGFVTEKKGAKYSVCAINADNDPDNQYGSIQEACAFYKNGEEIENQHGKQKRVLISNDLSSHRDKLCLEYAVQAYKQIVEKLGLVIADQENQFGLLSNHFNGVEQEIEQQSEIAKSDLTDLSECCMEQSTLLNYLNTLNNVKTEPSQSLADYFASKIPQTPDFEHSQQLLFKGMRSDGPENDAFKSPSNI